MGLIKKDGYEVKGVLIKPAYAKLMDFFTLPKQNNTLIAQFGISTTRDNLDEKLSLEMIPIEMEYNKHESLFEQMYNKAKEERFTDWEDDIVEEQE